MNRGNDREWGTLFLSLGFKIWLKSLIKPNWRSKKSTKQNDSKELQNPDL